MPSPLGEARYGRVDLPSLATIGLRDDITHCTALLTHLAFPMIARVHIFPSDVHVGADNSGPDLPTPAIPGGPARLSPGGRMPRLQRAADGNLALPDEHMPRRVPDRP